MPLVEDEGEKVTGAVVDMDDVDDECTAKGCRVERLNGVKIFKKCEEVCDKNTACNNKAHTRDRADLYAEKHRFSAGSFEIRGGSQMYHHNPSYTSLTGIGVLSERKE